METPETFDACQAGLAAVNHLMDAGSSTKRASTSTAMTIARLTTRRAVSKSHSQTRQWRPRRPPRRVAATLIYIWMLIASICLRSWRKMFVIVCRRYSRDTCSVHCYSMTACGRCELQTNFLPPSAPIRATEVASPRWINPGERETPTVAAGLCLPASLTPFKTPAAQVMIARGGFAVER